MDVVTNAATDLQTDIRAGDEEEACAAGVADLEVGGGATSIEGRSAAKAPATVTMTAAVASRHLVEHIYLLAALEVRGARPLTAMRNEARMNSCPICRF